MDTSNPWKMATIGMALVVVTAVVTTVVVANRMGGGDQPAGTTARLVDTPTEGSASPSMPPAARSAPAPVATPQTTHPVSPVPSRVAIDACNQYAASAPSTKDKTIEIVKDGAIGGALGAAVGAAGGAIAGGGSGAGKGAAIGGVVGLGGGALYGLNENKKNDERYRAAYAHCMRARGYSG